MDEYGDYLLDRDEIPEGYDPSEAWWEEVEHYYYEEHKRKNMFPMFEWEELTPKQKDKVAEEYKLDLQAQEQAYD